MNEGRPLFSCDGRGENAMEYVFCARVHDAPGLKDSFKPKEGK